MACVCVSVCVHHMERVCWVCLSSLTIVSWVTVQSRRKEATPVALACSWGWSVIARMALRLAQHIFYFCFHCIVTTLVSR